jgi:hypothetical protein
MLCYASEAATFGHAYRVEYEKLHHRKEMEFTRYNIISSDIYTFCAIAALGGIIGGMAY